MNTFVIPESYTPTDDEEFMNPRQQAYFKNLLTEWKRELLEETSKTISDMQNSSLQRPDLNDRASEETDRAIELRTRDRQRKLINKIDAALRRIEEGEYGYCEVTGNEISLKRLIARPIATMSLAAQEQHERKEKVHRD